MLFRQREEGRVQVEKQVGPTSASAKTLSRRRSPRGRAIARKRKDLTKILRPSFLTGRGTALQKGESRLIRDDQI